MSKTKNTPEFEAMMREQELAASFNYEETEATYAILREELAKLQAMQETRTAYHKAARELDIAMANYAHTVTNLHKLLNEEE